VGLVGDGEQREIIVNPKENFILYSDHYSDFLWNEKKLINENNFFVNSLSPKVSSLYLSIFLFLNYKFKDSPLIKLIVPDRNPAQIGLLGF